MEKTTPQFNLETEELASHAEALRPWRREVACTSPEPPSRRMTLEIFLESDTKKKEQRVLVERWVFRHDALVSAGPTPISDSQSLSVSAAYKQLVVFFRTLHAELRALPAHRYARRAAERSASGNPARGGFAVAFEVSGERTPEGVATGEDSKPPPRISRAEEKWSEPLPHSGGEEGGRASDTSTSLGMSGVSSSGILSSGLLHSSSSEGTGSIPSDDAPKRTRPSPREDASSDAYRTYAFAAAAAPGGGRLDASVYFLDADALAALDLGDMRETCKACKPTLVDAYAHEARGGSGSGSDGYASSPGGFFVGDKKTTSAFPRRAGSWKARATQFLATSPGSAKVGFAARAEPEDVDTPPPPSRVGIVLAGSGDAGTPPPGGSRGLGLLSAEMARFEPKNVLGSGGHSSSSPSSGGIVHPSSFVGSVGSPSGSDGPGSVPEKLHGSAFASGPATPSSSSRPPLSPLAPSSAPVFVGGGPPPIFGFAESDPHGFRSGSPAGSASSGGFLSALASRLASSPGMAIPGVGSLPFAFGSGSAGSRGSGGESSAGTRLGRETSVSLASPSHALAARGSDRSSDSPPWHFRGLLVNSGSGSGSPVTTTPGWRVDRNPTAIGGVSRRASWSSPSSSLSVSFQDGIPGFGMNQQRPGGPFAYGTSPKCAALALGSSPESVAGTPGRAEANATGSTLAAPSLVGAPGDADSLGPRRLASAFAADSADDALPFELDVEEEEEGRKSLSRESDEREEIDADAAVAALVRALREAPPLRLEPLLSDETQTRVMTLAGAKRRLQAMRREVVVAQRHRVNKSGNSSQGSSRASSEAEKREATASVEERRAEKAVKDEEKAEKTPPAIDASRAIDAAVDEALAFAAPL